MKCVNCDADMIGEYAFDTGTREPACVYNLYICDECGTITKEDVLKGVSLYSILPDNSFTS